jgi:hypothetical protein
MTALDKSPTNHNFLSPLNFKFQIKRAPHINFFIQEINLPSISIQPKDVGNPFVKIPYPGDHIDYSILKVKFKVDEDLKNYLEMHSWLRGLGFPKSFEEYSTLSSQNQLEGKGLRSDISLVVLNSTKLPNYEIVFTEAFPTFLSELMFSTTEQSVNYMTASVEFRYILYNIEKIT